MSLALLEKIMKHEVERSFEGRKGNLHLTKLIDKCSIKSPNT